MYTKTYIMDTRLKLFKSRLVLPVVCGRPKPDTSTVFQIRNCTKYISVDDVKDAFEKTKDVSYSKKVEYFGSKGIHYAKARRYYQVVRNLNNAFQQDLIVDVEFWDEPNDASNDVSNDVSNVVSNDVSNDVSKDVSKHVKAGVVANQIKSNDHKFDVLYIFALFIVLEVISYILN